MFIQSMFCMWVVIDKYVWYALESIQSLNLWRLYNVHTLHGLYNIRYNTYWYIYLYYELNPKLNTVHAIDCINGLQL